MNNKEAFVTKMKVMLELQDAMNAKVHPEWRGQNNPWYRAIWIECAEMMDHYGWKWWKKQEPDMEQVKLELVDIWHFGLSSFLQQGDVKPDVVYTMYLHHKQMAYQDFLQIAEAFSEATISAERFVLPGFFDLMNSIGMTFDELYSSYIGKNVLNFFRQDNGYKTGTYRKHWHDGREDNEHLNEIMASLDSESPDFKDLVYKGLAERYSITK